MDFEAFFKNELDGLHQEGRYRVFADLERQRGNFPRRSATRKMAAGSDRLVFQRLSRHGPERRRDGRHEDGNRPVWHRCRRHPQHFRHNHYHVLLERELADLHGKEAALLFNSGYMSNWASLGTLGAKIPGLIVFSDAGNHASMIEGIRHSKCERVSGSTMISRISKPSSRRRSAAPKLIAFESVYSMDGEIAPIKDICDIADKYGAMTYLDEVHAVGLYGRVAAALPNAKA